LSGRCALITGAGGGLGAAFARAFAGQRARIVAADIDEHAAARVAEELRHLGHEAVAVHVDVADESSATAMAGAAARAFDQVDVLVNNAAVYAGPP
jgi:NAD(P)-dependent dehydrogenase (short-subunit alcohol dehydrogenase family)